jgi:TonB-linked SusC/RagA family outer membrane protein
MKLTTHKQLLRYFRDAVLCMSGLLCGHIAAAQSITVTGTVSDAATGEPLIGVTVVQKDLPKGVWTDVEGRYAITVPENAILVFSYLGYATHEQRVTSSLQNVKLTEKVNSLDEVVVIGYGTQRKGDVTTAVVGISSNEWANRPILSAQQAMQGKAAGVEIVQPSGKPGVGLRVRVRGTSSLSAGNDPLYIVDGIPMEDISTVQPNDIESIHILKDASSAAIYGSRGANGVILLTTKKGRKGKAQVNVSMYTGFSNVSKQINTLNTVQYYDLMDELGIPIDRSNTHYTDWAKEMYGTGMQQNYQASLSGGTETLNYYFSGSYQKDAGIIAPSEFDRYTFRSNVSATLNSRLKISSNISLARTNTSGLNDNNSSETGGVITAILNTPPFLTIWDADNPDQYAVNPFQASWENPYAQANTYANDKNYHFAGNIELDFTLAKGLHFRPNFAIDYSSRTWNYFLDPVKTGYGRQSNGAGDYNNTIMLSWVSENIVSYETSFNEKHHLKAMAGVTLQREAGEMAYITGDDFVKGTTLSRMGLNMANRITDAGTLDLTPTTLMSSLARVQYDYAGRYLFTANFRADGSSKLAHKWDYFPSVSAGWRFSDEVFFESLKTVVDDAKIRGGWGRTGNQNGIDNSAVYRKYDVTRDEQTGDGPAVDPGKLGNSDLKWEVTTQYNAGLDVTLFGGRLTGAFDWYYKHTTDMLIEIMLPSSVGTTLPLRNDGQMVNQGFEFNLAGQMITGSDWKWDAEVNMSFNRNKVTKLGLTPVFYTGYVNNGGGEVVVVKEGLPLGSFFGYVYEGVDPQTGDAMYHDYMGEGNPLSPQNRRVIGCAQPDFTFGITSNLSWKNLSLNAFFNGSYGNDIYNATRIETEGMFDSKNQSVAVLNRWTRPGMVTDIPRAVRNKTNCINSSRFVEDGSYIRLKSLTLAYNFSPDFLKPAGVSQLSVYATVNNLFTLTKYKGYDPELSWDDYDDENSVRSAQMGIDYGTYPQVRSFIIGINLTF